MEDISNACKVLNDNAKKKEEAKRKGLVEKMFNKFGYHKGLVSIIVIDKEQIKNIALFNPPPLTG